MELGRARPAYLHVGGAAQRRRSGPGPAKERTTAAAAVQQA
jgi:hypothetical protein